MIDVLPRLTAFARDEESVRALVLFGSHARHYCPADEFSDYDFLVLSEDVPRFIESEEWLARLFNVAISFREPTLAGGTELRFLTREAQDVDLLFLDARRASEIACDADVRTMLSRGYRVLVDRIGFAEMLGAIEQPAYHLPTEAEFLNLARDFAFHLVWTTKKAERGEIWVAKSCTDGYLKGLLLSMLEFHAKAMHGVDYNVWHGGRFLDRWANADIVQRLPQTFAAYDAHDVLRALSRMAELFREIASEAARSVGYPSPDDALEFAAKYIDARHNMFGAKR